MNVEEVLLDAKRLTGAQSEASQASEDRRCPRTLQNAERVGWTRHKRSCERDEIIAQVRLTFCVASK